MKRKTMDSALTDIRNTPITSDQVEQAATRVLATLTAEHNKVVFHPAVAEGQAGERIRNCADFQSLILAYLSASLTPSRKLLFEDHIRDCVACRRALQTARNGSTARTESPGPRALRSQAHRGFETRTKLIAVAAAVLMVVGISQRNAIRDFVWPIDVHAVALTVNGGLFRIAGQDVRTIAAGERIDRYQSVRTGNESGAVLELADGSRIEMNSRSELALDRANDGVRIQLARGSVIVTAAKQRTGHLYVATNDCMVSVVGTVFSVNSGSKGSRVSVIEGEVHVQQGSASQALHPGMQIATSAILGTVPVETEIAWSRDSELHIAMMKELVALSRDLEQRLSRVELRYNSNLVPLVPAGTLVFASLPNVSQPVAESYAAMKQRISENAILQQWWNENPGKASGGLSIDELVGRVTRVGNFLGPEIVLSIQKDSPILLADVIRPTELLDALQDDIARMSAFAQPNEVPVRLVRNAAELEAAGTNRPIVYVDSQFMIAGIDSTMMLGVLAARQQPTAFASSSIGQRVAQAYRDGAGWLLAADLSQLGDKDAHQEVPGLGNVEQLVVEQKTGSGGSSYQAVLGFNGPRTGPATWLGSPGTIGAAEFVSPHAYGAAAIVTKDPALILDDIFAIVARNGNELENLQQFQRDHGIDLRYDLAAPLGNEFLIAVDGPILPTPSWKLVVEVNDAARLQNSLQWMVAELNREAAAEQKPGISSGTEVVGGRTFYSLTSTPGLSLHYTFWAGYLIAAPSRTLLSEAMQYHDTGTSLGRSADFRSQFPADGNDNASGFVYQNLQAVAAAIPLQIVQDTVAGALPSLVCLYGESDRIMVSSKGILGSNLASMAGLSSMIQAIGIK